MTAKTRTKAKAHLRGEQILYRYTWPRSSRESSADIRKNALKKLPTKIGVISDTHGLLRPEALKALRGSQLIIHAGDVGGREIIESLEKIAPVVAVRGNTDRDSWGASLPETVVVEAEGALIYALHDFGALDLNPAVAGFQIVVSGHSHKPLRQQRDGYLHLNPGSAGPRRFSLPLSVARVDLEPRPWQIELVEICGAENKR
jgi:putative phosphoesterase